MTKFLQFHPGTNELTDLTVVSPWASREYWTSSSPSVSSNIHSRCNSTAVHGIRRSSRPEWGQWTGNEYSTVMVDSTQSLSTFRPRQNDLFCSYGWPDIVHTEGLVQDCSNSIANALELLQSSTKPEHILNTQGCYEISSSQHWRVSVNGPTPSQFPYIIQ